MEQDEQFYSINLKKQIKRALFHTSTPERFSAADRLIKNSFTAATVYSQRQCIYV